MRLDEINQRLSAIRTELETGSPDLEALETEVGSLQEEKRSILDKAEKRKALLEGVAGLENPTVIKSFEKDEKEVRTMELNKDNVLGSAEYRSAFLNKLRGIELSDLEKRALTTAEGSVGAVLPTQTQNNIVTKVKQYAPLLDEVTLLQVAGNVKFAVESTINEASLHTEGASITASTDTMITVSLGGYEITKLITISKSVATMSIAAFEDWLTNMLAESIANKISGYLINGTGSSQPQGVEKAQTWGETNSVNISLSLGLTADKVQTLCGLLPGGYDNGAKFLMSKKTLFTDFMPLQDSSKHALVSKEGNTYYIYGYPVLFDERVTYHEAFLGNFKKAIVANLAENVTVNSGFDTKTNSFDFLGCAIFDSKVAVGEAVVKLIKATT